MDAASQYALAYALTTSAGLRAIAALALVSIAAHFGVLHPSGTFEWLGHATVMWILSGIAVVEALADKVPFLDHALHVAQVVVKPAAAVIIVGGTVHPQSQDTLIFLMIVGALNALGVHAGVATVRAASTTTTGGLANPFVSTAEDAAAVGGGLLAFIMPFVIAAIALVCTIVLILVGRKAYPWFRSGGRRTSRG